jgi:radical SAM/Cys-rich protein
MGDSTRVGSDGSLRVLQSGASSLTFDEALKRSCGPLLRGPVSTLQINVGKLCNQACHHCHVDAGPKRTEVMTTEVAERLLHLLAATPAIATVDVTGGAPELNPNFRRLVTRSRELDREVIDRCNLTVLFEPGMAGLGEFLAENKVQIVASLPCYTPANVDAQRGRGVFEKSIRSLQRLNSLGYGKPGSSLTLDLVYNPLGPTLPPEQSRLEADYKSQLRDNFGIEFHRLFTLANMPISRFGDLLRSSGKYGDYMALLAGNFNPSTVAGLMCRSLISVGWDGALYDCDFNQMLGIGMSGRRVTVWDLESFSHMEGKLIATGTHCFGCTAGAGSSCGGALQ